MSAFVDMLTMVCVEVLQGIRNVENALSSECVTPGGSGDAGDPAFHGFPMDAKREHNEFLEVRRDANRFALVSPRLTFLSPLFLAND